MSNGRDEAANVLKSLYTVDDAGDINLLLRLSTICHLSPSFTYCFNKVMNTLKFSRIS